MLLAGACADETLFVPQVWGDDVRVALIATDDAGNVLEPTPIVIEQAVQTVEVSGDARHLYARRFDLLDRDEGCFGATLGEDGIDAGVPTEAWHTRVDAGRSWEVESEPLVFGLRLLGCTPPKPCDAVGAIQPMPATYAGLRGIAAVDDDEVWLAGRDRAEDDTSTLVGRFGPGGFEPLPPIPGIRSESSNLDLLPDGSLLGTTVGGWTFRLATDGTVISTSSTGQQIRDADTAPDGTTALVSDDGDVALLAPGAATPEMLPAFDVDPRDPASRPRISIWSRDRILVRGPDRKVRLFDGTAWRVVFQAQDVELEAIAIDASHMLVQQKKLATMIFDETTDEWTPHEQAAFVLTNSIVATPFGDGRFFIAGQSGAAAYFNGERVCSLARTLEMNLSDLSVSPSGRFVWAAGDNDERNNSPLVVRYEIP